MRKAYVNLEAPLDVDGQPCSLSPSAVERNDRADIRGPYYLTSDFEPRKSIADRRCYRQAVVSVKHSEADVSQKSFLSVGRQDDTFVWKGKTALFLVGRLELFADKADEPFAGVEAVPGFAAGVAEHAHGEGAVVFPWVFD